MTLVLERDNLQQKWGLTIQGGADLALTAKIASVKVLLTRLGFIVVKISGNETELPLFTLCENEKFQIFVIFVHNAEDARLSGYLGTICQIVRAVRTEECFMLMASLFSRDSHLQTGLVWRRWTTSGPSITKR